MFRALTKTKAKATSKLTQISHHSTKNTDPELCGGLRSLEAREDLKGWWRARGANLGS